ncbi:hypothetical protein ACFLXL_00380 [Chloroflexota bacterium]
MIRAPSMAGAGQPVTITVFGKFNHEPIAGAEVYALKIDRTASTADEKNYTTTAEETVALLDEEGIFFGTTNNEGNVTGKFANTGRYIIVAFKAGYFPAFSRISITLSNSKKLAIRAPGSVDVGNPVTMAIRDSYSQKAVARVAVYAQKIDTISSIRPKPAVATIFDTIIGIFKPTKKTPVTNTRITKAEPVEIIEEVQDVEAIQKRGFLLGYTDDNGKLTHTFAETGNYVLAAIMEGYTPGFARIKITPSERKKLSIKAPERAEVNKTVTITVFERYTSQVIPKASVYAIWRGDIPTPVAVPAKKPTTLVSTPESLISDASLDIETVKEKGIFLGYTDERGQVLHSFNKTGQYVLAAIKDEYQPGFARILISLASQKALVIRAPDKAEVGTPVNMMVFERSNSQPVPKAAVYALKMGDIPTASTANSELAISTTEAENAEVVKNKGLLIGYTNDRGQLRHSFDKTGLYMLAAIKDEYLPGFARINVVLAGQKTIGIKVPEKAEVGQPVTIVTYERNTYGPVPKAGVYALRLGEFNTPLPLEETIKSDSASLIEAENQVADIKAKGIFLGYTNENAHLVYSFNKTGHYLLVAAKEGYIPGLARTTIVPTERKALLEKVKVGETPRPVTINKKTK